MAELERFRRTGRSTGRLRRRSSLRHENIVEYLGAEIEEADRKLHIFQEWVPGGSLSAVVRTFGGRLDDDVNRRYLEHCLRGLVYLHEHRVVHRDIKGENVLISDTGVAKLADMGASKRIHAEGTLLDTESSLKGTPYFMAPEQMRQKRVGRRADVWAMGGLALLMATGDPPWKVLKMNSPYALMMAVLDSDQGPPLEAYADKLAPQLKDFMSTCFTRDVDARPTARAMLHHPFLEIDDDPTPRHGRANVNAVGPEPNGGPPPRKDGSSSALENLKNRMSRDRHHAPAPASS